MFEAERFDQALSQDLKQIGDRFERQFHLLSWFFEQYDRLLSRDNIVFYEDIVSTRGAALNVMTELASTLSEPLSVQNNNPLYNQRLKQTLGEKLLMREGAIWDFYSKASVEELLVVK